MNTNIPEFLQKLFYFLASFLVIMGGVSAICMAIVYHEWVITFGSVCVCCAAIPTVANWIKKLIE